MSTMQLKVTFYSVYIFSYYIVLQKLLIIACCNCWTKPQ